MWINQAAKTDPETVEQIVEEIGREQSHNEIVTSGVGIADLAKLLDVSTGTINMWRRNGCPFTPGGKKRANQWDPVKVFRWYLKNRKHSHSDDEARQIERDTKREILLAKQMKRQELAGELVRAEVVRDEVRMYVELMREIGSRLESKFGREALEILNDGLEEIKSRVESNE